MKSGGGPWKLSSLSWKVWVQRSITLRAACNWGDNDGRSEEQTNNAVDKVRNFTQKQNKTKQNKQPVLFSFQLSGKID